MKRRFALLVGALVGVLLVAAPTRPAGAAGFGGGRLQYIDQTQWLEGAGQYNFRIGLAGASPSDRIEVLVFHQIHFRSTFQQDAAGNIQDRSFYRQAVPVTSLQPAGKGFDVQLPVNEAAPPGDPFSEVPIGETGVFPVQIQLLDAAGTPIGEPITTFLVYVVPAVSAGEITPLSAALVIPIGSTPAISPAGTLGPPDRADAARLNQLAGVLNNDQSVHASLLASPLTLAGLAAGKSPADQQALANLNGATVGGPFEVLPATYSPVSLGDLQDSLPSEVQPQLQAGAQTLQQVFGVAPGPVWAVDGPLDGSTLGVLLAQHVTRLIVPDSDLTSYPSNVTFAGANHLDVAGARMDVVAADPGLTADFARLAPPVLAANELLAELAMIYTEEPSQQRGVALMPPAGWVADPDFVGTLISGLKANPLVSAVTASALFGAVGTPQGTRMLAGNQPPAGPGYSNAAVAQISNARVQIGDLAALVGPAQVTALKAQLLLAESETLPDRERSRILSAIDRALTDVQRSVTLPPATSITLTSNQGVVPITILTLGTVHPRVELQLQSPQLIFRPFVPRNGTCQVEGRTREVCVLTLEAHNTTLRVPVETRSSGVFRLEVSLGSPGGVPFLVVHDTVRSTAVSGVAIVVIIVALAALVLWWGRDLRRGRRPKGMVPLPAADADGRGPLGDPEMDGFFDRPPPDFGAMSPSGSRTGPRTTTEPYGRSGRETGD